MRRRMSDAITTDIVLKIIGHTDARGETEYDEESLENLFQLEDIMLSLSAILYDNIVDNRNSNSFSRTQIYEKSKEILEEINGTYKDAQKIR